MEKPLCVFLQHTGNNSKEPYDDDDDVFKEAGYDHFLLRSEDVYIDRRCVVGTGQGHGTLAGPQSQIPSLLPGAARTFVRSEATRRCSNQLIRVEGHFDYESPMGCMKRYGETGPIVDVTDGMVLS
jgi:hypothetical protein